MTAVKMQAKKKQTSKVKDYDLLEKLSQDVVNAWANMLSGKIELEKAIVPLRKYLEESK